MFLRDVSISEETHFLFQIVDIYQDGRRVSKDDAKRSRPRTLPPNHQQCGERDGQPESLVAKETRSDTSSPIVGVPNRDRK